MFLILVPSFWALFLSVIACTKEYHQLFSRMRGSVGVWTLIQRRRCLSFSPTCLHGARHSKGSAVPEAFRARSSLCPPGPAKPSSALVISEAASVTPNNVGAPWEITTPSQLCSVARGRGLAPNDNIKLPLAVLLFAVRTGPKQRKGQRMSCHRLSWPLAFSCVQSPSMTSEPVGLGPVSNRPCRSACSPHTKLQAGAPLHPGNRPQPMLGLCCGLGPIGQA